MQNLSQHQEEGSKCMVQSAGVCVCFFLMQSIILTSANRSIIQVFNILSRSFACQMIVCLKLPLFYRHCVNMFIDFSVYCNSLLHNCDAHNNDKLKLL